MSEEAEKKDVGAVWIKTSKKKTKYLGMSINIDGINYNFVAFKNHKKKPSHPDYRIFPSETQNKSVKNDPDPINNDNDFDDQPMPDEAFPF